MVKELVTERLKLKDFYPDKAKSIAKEYGLEEGDVELIRKGRISEEAVIDRKARTVKNYISTDAKDRDNEVIQHRGVVLDDYKKNPIVPWAHDYRGLPIGKNLWIKSDKKGLVAKTYFLEHDFAEDVFDLYTKDIHGTGPAMKAWSVGFVPLKWKNAKPSEEDKNSFDRGEIPQGVRRTYTKWILLEYSAVPVPCNPEALTLMVEKGMIKSDKLKSNIEDYIKDYKEETEMLDKVAKEKVEKQGEEAMTEWSDGITITEEELLSEIEKGVIPFRETAKAPEDEKWEGTREVREAEVSDLEIMCTWVDSEDPDTKGSYKLPHHKADGHSVVWKGVAAAMAALLGARGGVQIPEKDRKGVYNHLVKEYKRFDKEPPDFKEYTEVELKNMFAEDVKIGEATIEVKADITQFEAELDRMKEKYETLAGEMGILKEGRVLSGKNLNLVKDCREQIGKTAELLDKLIVASEPPKEESILPLIEESKSKDNGNSIDGLSKKDIPVVIEEVLKGIKGSLEGQRQQIINQQEKIKETFSKTLGKV